MKKKIGLVILILLIFSTTACTFQLSDNGILTSDDGDLSFDDNIESGDIKTFTESFDNSGIESAEVEIDVNSANINISKSEQELFKGEVKTNVKGMEPIFRLNENRLIISDKFNYKGFNNIHNKWDLKFTDNIPLSFDININAVNNEFDLTDLMVKEFKINTNASNTVIRANNKNNELLENFNIEMNAGKLEIRELGNMNIKNLNISMNAGNLDIDFGEKIYRDISIEFDGNVSEVDIDIPEDVGIKISNIDSLSDINVRNNKVKSKNGDYTTNNFESSSNRVIINLRGALLNMDIK